VLEQYKKIRNKIMTYLLGLIGVLQMLLIPGLILYRILGNGHQKNFWIDLPLILTFSFMINYAVVFSLTSLHFYLPIVLRIIVALELLALFYCYPRFWTQPFMLYEKHEKIEQGQHTRIYFWIFAAIFGIMLWQWVSNLGMVFGIRDPSVSYNIWAIAWSQNQFPILTWHYPQLLTTNWSIPYVMMGTLPNNIVLEMFPASLNELFPILFMIIFFDLFRRERNRAYLLAGIITSIWMYAEWIYIHNGHMDWVCAFFNLLSLKLIYDLSHSTQKTFPWRAYLQIILVISASILVKPAGLATAILAPLLLVALVRFDTCKRPELLLMLSYALIALLVLPWYIYAENHEVLHSQGSDLLFLIWNIFRINSWLFYFDEIIYLSWAAVIMLIFTYFFSKSLPRFWRFVFYFFGPYFFVWAFFYSYDVRNLTLLLPILSVWVSLIIIHNNMDLHVITYVRKNGYRINQLSFLFLALGISASAVYVINNLQQTTLIQHETVAKDNIFDIRPGFMEVKRYTISPGFNGKILSPMLIYHTIPLLSPLMIQMPPETYGADMLPQVFNDPKMLQQTLINYPDIRYFLFDMRFRDLVTSDATRKIISHWEDTGKIKPIINKDKILVYQILVPLTQLDFTIPANPSNTKSSMLK
jgi:hypothetical protein